jgi:hypothetical protein
MHALCFYFKESMLTAYLGPKAPFFLRISSSSSRSSWSILAPLLGSLPWFLACNVIRGMYDGLFSRKGDTYGESGILLALGDLSGLRGRLLLTLGLTLELVGNGTLVLCIRN